MRQGSRGEGANLFHEESQGGQRGRSPFLAVRIDLMVQTSSEPEEIIVA